MKKSTLIIGGTILLLLAAIIVLAVVNSGNTRELVTGQDGASFAINAKGETHTVTLEMLEEIGLQDFTATKKGGGGPAVEVAFQGVPLVKICEKLGLDVADAEGCIAVAADGYAVPVELEKVLDPENVFIATGEDGESLGNKDEGGDGPFMLVIAKDPFSQYWCKFLSEVTFE